MPLGLGRRAPSAFRRYRPVSGMSARYRLLGSSTMMRWNRRQRNTALQANSVQTTGLVSLYYASQESPYDAGWSIKTGDMVPAVSLLAGLQAEEHRELGSSENH